MANKMTQKEIRIRIDEVKSLHKDVHAFDYVFFERLKYLYAQLPLKDKGGWPTKDAIELEKLL